MPTCADTTCARWRPGTFASRWIGGGLRLNGQWYCSRGCFESAVEQGLTAVPTAESFAAFPPLRLGALLRHHHVITPLQLTHALDVQQETGLRLGAQLQALGYTTAEVVLRALAEQASASYLTHVDWSWMAGAPGGLPGNTVRALGLVPFAADERRRRLHVMCMAPLPRAALRALVKLTGWTPDPYLVDDRLWARALAEYRPADSPVAFASLLVNNVRAACARVADAAVASGTVTMRHADCLDYTWVRVEAPARVDDVLVAASAAAGENSLCLAAPTAH
jgi:hypothetical protein